MSFLTSSGLIVSINSITDGSITLQIPRSLLDAKLVGGQDTGFTISIDGAEVKPQSEQDNADYRTLAVAFLQGDQNIQIIGTNTLNGSSIPQSNNSTGNPNNPYVHTQNQTTPIPSTPAKIPNWVKAVFGYYAQGNLSDDDLINALQFLIKQGIIKLS